MANQAGVDVAEVDKLIAQGLTPEAAIGNLVMGNRPQAPSAPVTNQVTNPVGVQEQKQQEGGLSSTVNNLLDGISTAFDAESIAEQERRSRAEIRKQADTLFNPKIEQAQQLGEQQVGSIEAQLGVGRGLGLSSAGIQLINNAKKEVEGRIKDIQKAKQDFIGAGDFRAAQRADAQLAQMQQANNNLILKKVGIAIQLADMEDKREQFAIRESRLANKDLFEQALSLRKLGFEIDKFNDGKDRFERTQGLKEMQFNLEVDEKQRERVFKQISQSANSKIPLESFSDEEISILEAESGMLPGTFEAVYSKLYEDARLGELANDLKIRKMQADIARTLRLARGGADGVQVSEGFVNSKVESSVREDAVSLLSDVDNGDITVEQAFRRLRTLYSPNEVDDSAILNLLGIEPVGAEDLQEEPIPGSTEPVQSFAERGLPKFGTTYQDFSYELGQEVIDFANNFLLAPTKGLGQAVGESASDFALGK